MKKAIITTIIAINIINITNGFISLLTEMPNHNSWVYEAKDLAFVVEGGEVTYSGSYKEYEKECDERYKYEM